MVAFDYLKEQLTEFVKTFKNVKVNYEYDQLANLHTIEVLPQVVFDSVYGNVISLNVLMAQSLMRIFLLSQKMLM